MAEFDYEVVDGRKIRVRPQEVVSEIDENGYFVRQPNHFTEGFGEGKNPVEKGRYHLVWAKLCHWSNRASIVRELLGLEDAISVNMVDHAKHEKNLGWEFVYDKDHIDPVLGIQFLSEAYYKADDDYTGRTTVPALIDTKTGKVVNNDYTWLTNYFEVDFKPFHKKGAPDLYPEELRKDIDEMNDWLFDNINNGVYKATFARSKEAYWDAYNSFYAAMDILEKRLENQRFLFGDYVTDSDVRLYVTLARLDIRYTWQLGHTKHRLIDYPNLWGYARDLYQIPAFRNNTYFKDFANPNNKKVGALFFESFNARFLDEINFDAYWGAPHDRAHLSSDPGNKFKAGGQQQRVAIARALAMEPKLLLLDEPTSALDPELVGEVLDTIKKAANEGYTMLLVSHEMSFVRNVATRVIFLDGGKILEDGTPREVFGNPKNERVKEFFTKINRMEEPDYSI